MTGARDDARGLRARRAYGMGWVTGDDTMTAMMTSAGAMGAG